MRKSVFVIALIALFIGAAVLSSGATNSDDNSKSLDNTHLRADISTHDEYEWEYKFNIGRFYFGNKITINVEKYTKITPFPRIGWLWGSSYEIEPGSTVEITSPYIRIKIMSEYPPYEFMAKASNVNVKVIE